MLGFPVFDPDAFSDLVSQITIPETGTMIFELTDGQTVEHHWHRNAKKDCWTQELRDQASAYRRRKRFDALSNRFEAAKAKSEEVSQQISDKQSRKAEMGDALKLLKKQDGEIAEFREGLWTGLLDYATIYADGRMTFTFKTGQTIDG